MAEKLKIVFMGTPDFSVPCLHALAKSGHRVQAVFTQPDKPKGRGYKLIPTPVKAAAGEYGIPVYQPLSLRKGEDARQALEVLRELQPDLIVVVAYGQILPVEVLELPRFGCVNIHASLLPGRRSHPVVHPQRRNRNRRYLHADGAGAGHGGYAHRPVAGYRAGGNQQ